MRILKRMAVSATMMAALFSAVGATAQWSISGNAASASDFLGATNAADVKIRTNNAERIRIIAAGLMGVNTTTPERRLHLHRTASSPQMRLGESSADYWDINGGYDFTIIDPTAATWLAFSPSTTTAGFSLGPNFDVYCDVPNGGKFGFYTSITTLVGRAMSNGHVVPETDNMYTAGTATYRWDIVYACNGVIQTSDAKFKENIHDMKYGIDDVMRLHPVSYAWQGESNGKRQLGLVAQEIRPVIGEVVKEGPGDEARLGVAYSDFVPVLIGAVQDQQKDIQKRKDENQLLREQMKERAERIVRMEAALEALR